MAERRRCRTCGIRPLGFRRKQLCDVCASDPSRAEIERRNAKRRQDAEEVWRRVRGPYAGLTRRQATVLLAAWKVGKVEKTAEYLGVSYDTVKNTITRAYRILGMAGKAEGRRGKTGEARAEAVAAYRARASGPGLALLYGFTRRRPPPVADYIEDPFGEVRPPPSAPAAGPMLTRTRPPGMVIRRDG